MGQRPVAAFGNSDGDLAMMQYTASNPDYKTFGLLVHHTDAAREYAYDSHPPASGKLVEGLKVAKEKGWVVVDMQKTGKRYLTRRSARRKRRSSLSGLPFTRRLRRGGKPFFFGHHYRLIRL